MLVRGNKTKWSCVILDEPTDREGIFVVGRNAIPSYRENGARPRTTQGRLAFTDLEFFVSFVALCSKIELVSETRSLIRRHRIRQRTGLTGYCCRRGLRPPMWLTPIGTSADDRRTEPPPTKKDRRDPCDL